MADVAVADPPPPPPQPSLTVNDFNSLQVPALDPHFLNQELPLTDDGAFNFNSVDQNDDVIFGDLGFDLEFSFEDLLSDSLEQPFLEPECFVLPGSDPNLTQFVPDRSLKDVTKALKSTSPEFLHVSGGNFSGDGVISNSSSLQVPEVCELSEDQDSDGQCSERNQLSGDRGQDVSGYLNFPSPESNGSKGSNDSRVLNCPSPESQGSGNCGSDVSEDSNKSVSYSPNFGNTSTRNTHKVKFEELNNGSQALLKRKKESEDSDVSDSRTNKFRKSNHNLIETADSKNNNGVLSEEDEKRRARLMRNRESAQLSRQRKKHYVEELEDKVKNMGSTIQELNSQIAFISHENARLRQQLGGGMMPPAPMAGPPPPGIYPQMMYPWMPCGVPPPYLVKPQGSQVPLVPIPRLKPQQPAPAPKASKKESKKNEKSEGKTKKVASVSFLGLMFFILLFGGLVPMVNVRYGGVREAFRDGSGYAESRFYEKHYGKVLAVDGSNGGKNYGDRYGNERDLIKNKHPGRGHGGNAGHEIDGSAHVDNDSALLAASLYVPRNDKLVKIDGNLIIHSFLASERAMASRADPAKKAGGETQLAVHGDVGPVFPISGGRHPRPCRNPNEHQRALGSSVKENLKSSAVDGRLQEWFREGLEGRYFQMVIMSSVLSIKMIPLLK